MIAGGFINLFKDGSDRLPGCIGSYREGFVKFWNMQRGDIAECRLEVMDDFLESIGQLDTHL